MPRPAFTSAWAASKKIFSPLNPEQKVAEVIGGNVAANITSTTNPWRNTCAVRMSYILNSSGIVIPKLPGATVSGADKRQYFFRVPDVISFLIREWGKPDLIVKTPLSSDPSLKNKKGVVMFEVSGWSDARGHASLWNSQQCYDHCYFNEPGANYRTDRVSFWSLS